MLKKIYLLILFVGSFTSLKAVLEPIIRLPNGNLVTAFSGRVVGTCRPETPDERAKKIQALAALVTWQSQINNYNQAR